MSRKRFRDAGRSYGLFHIGAHDLARNAGSRDGGQIYAMLFRDLTGQRRTSVLGFSGIFQYS